MKSPAFIPIATNPLNGAPDPATLVARPATAARDFFVRNHADPPAAVDVPALEITGLVQRAGRISLEGLPRTTVEATLQCAGNRRCGLTAHRPIPNEVPWTNEAISNAVWEGVSLAAVLDRAGINTSDPTQLHVWFVGADVIAGKGANDGFGASIPFRKAMSPEVILADHMNGAPLQPDHGAPLRVIVPGYIGARSVKWLTNIRVDTTPSTNYFQNAYALITEPGAAPEVLGELRVNAAFALPDDAVLPAGRTTVRGWAMAGGDSTIIRVEVSADGGATWQDARFVSPERRFVWRLWEADVTLNPGPHELVCRATDSRGATQPSSPTEVWNVRGYMNNSWHRVAVRTHVA